MNFSASSRTSGAPSSERMSQPPSAFTSARRMFAVRSNFLMTFEMTGSFTRFLGNSNRNSREMVSAIFVGVKIKNKKSLEKGEIQFHASKTNLSRGGQHHFVRKECEKHRPYFSFFEKECKFSK